MPETKTPLGQLLAEDKDLLKALEGIMQQVTVWDALDTRPELEEALAKHGIEWREVRKPRAGGDPGNCYLDWELG